ncbi:hypothetical protein Atai01_47100 [Amycolatopsis taiwanensis]|uniref:Uncharacterized protein n=1 Tax=Amycolatopsis taiwanensis TaxID=342230 RepID=A0A9W6VJ35_9PSEU|nr:hypothetical protein Atai01_47100 [Amycolatopsis taiwanensis]
MLGAVIEQLANELGNPVGAQLDHLGEPVELVGEHDAEQFLLIAEMVVDRALVGFGTSRDSVDSRAADAVLGELGDGGSEDPSLGWCGIPGHGNKEFATPVPNEPVRLLRSAQLDHNGSGRR